MMKIVYYLFESIAVWGVLKWLLSDIWGNMHPNLRCEEDGKEARSAYVWITVGVFGTVCTFAYEQYSSGQIQPIQYVILYVAVATLTFSGIDVVRLLHLKNVWLSGNLKQAYVSGLRRVQMLVLTGCGLGVIMSLLGLSLVWSSCVSILVVVGLHFMQRISK